MFAFGADVEFAQHWLSITVKSWLKITSDKHSTMRGSAKQELGWMTINGISYRSIQSSAGECCVHECFATISMQQFAGIGNIFVKLMY